MLSRTRGDPDRADAQNNGVRSNSGINGGYQALREPNNTIGVWLQAAGYRTALVGKMLNQYSYSSDGTPDGWDYWDPTIGKIYVYDAFVQARNGNPTEYQDAYITDYIAAETEALIQNYSAGDQPFFIWASHIAPHGSIRDDNLGGPPIPSPAYAGRYADVPSTSLAAPSFNEPHNQDKPRELARLDPVDPEKMQLHFSRRLESLASVDDAVAGTVTALRDAGVLDNTVLIFTSDNGYLLGEHRYKGKIYAFEESVRVPFLMRGPGVAAGVSTDQVVTTVDIAATMLEAAGASPGRLQDGTSFLPWGLPGHRSDGAGAGRQQAASEPGPTRMALPRECATGDTPTRSGTPASRSSTTETWTRTS